VGAASGNSPWTYRIHGLTVRSEIEFDAARVEPAPDRPDIDVVRGDPRDVPFEPPDGELLAELDEGGPAAWVTERGGERVIRYCGACDATISEGGRRLAVQPATGTDPALLSTYLVGGLLAHVLVVMDRLVLHASAVETGSGALLFAGQSGAGKSTLAAQFCAAGMPLVGDDAIRLEPDSSGGAICFPGSTTVRLRPAAAAVAERIDGAVGEAADGRLVVRPAAQVTAALPVAGLVSPVPTRGGRLGVERLGELDAMVELLRHPRLAAWRSPGPIGRTFELTADLAGAFPVYRATVPWGPPFPPDLPGSLLAELGLPAPEYAPPA